MPSVLLNCRQTCFTLRHAFLTSRGYAKKADANLDERLEAIRRAVYPPHNRRKESPVGTWRRDVGRVLQRAIPSKQAHETIERAWMLRKRHTRKAHEEELVRKFECMRAAMEELQRVEPHLYSEANKAEDPRTRSQIEMQTLKQMSTLEKKTLEGRIRGLFPRELRIPTDTPSRSGWNYDWTPLNRPL
ncbi:hypothetical protein FISHEDRAFT_47478 [Fistulina hepatica ATCC 64428]|uniref:Large ribosomal subunit protein mL40 n=1 Tax=Fistulina hepatica ATCC 64428 TaxID=1128425 RepID=A0A0D7A6J3_9AGAR|nr:hypothetical protein FISHEDRAFT_47478 [Fistulina hepatica ATCC 64428]